MKKKILMLDDHKVILNLVGDYLTKNLEIDVISALSIEEFESINENIDIYILDFSLEDGNGFDVLEILSSQNKHDVIIYTSNMEPGVIKHLIKHKLVKGVVNKASSEVELVNSVKAVLAGNEFLCKRSIQIINSTRRSIYDLELQEAELTNREREILNLIWDNLSTEDISKKLSISTHTVENHRKNIKRKFGADSIISIIRIAISKGYINTLSVK